jgi:hypothetical protein
MSTKSTNCCAQIRRSAKVAPKNGLGYTLEHSAVINGKKRGFPQGTVHERFTVPTPLPARKNTLPLWLSSQNFPLVSRLGLMLAGMEINHPFHFAAHSL